MTPFSAVAQRMPIKCIPDSEGSVVGEASLIDSENHPSPNFHRGRGSKSAMFGLVFNIKGENVLCRRLFDFAQILYRVWTHDARSTTKDQDQGVKGQGHSVM